VIKALGWWGIRYMSKPADTDEFRGQWFAYPVDSSSSATVTRRPAGVDRAPRRRGPAVVEVSGGEVRLRAGSVPGPDLVCRGRRS